jgi:uncharacterized membrane protein YqjE
VAGDRRRGRDRLHRGRPLEPPLSADATGTGTRDAPGPDAGRAADDRRTAGTADGPGAGAEPPSFETVGARLAARAVELVATRVALAAVELREARGRLVGSLVLLGVALAAALLALLLATFVVVAYYWDTHRYRAIAVVTLVHVVVAAVALWRVRVQSRAAPPLLGATVDQLRRDARALDPRDRGGA